MITERQKMDLNDEDNLVKTLQCFTLFSDDAVTALQNIATKDIVTVNIENDLLMTRQKGQDQLIQCIENRLTSDENGNRKVTLRDTLPRNIFF